MLNKHFKNQPLWILDEKNFKQWCPHFAGLKKEVGQRSQKRGDEILSFWYSFFYKLLLKDVKTNEEYFTEPKCDSLSENELVDNDTRIIKVKHSIFVKAYKAKVYQLLEDNKSKVSSEKDMFKKRKMLKELQKEIESLTMNFSEENIHASCSNILKMLVTPNKPDAKEFLLSKYKVDKEKGGRITILHPGAEDGSSVEENLQPLLTDEEVDILNEFGPLTIECIMIYVLCTLFNIEHTVSLASLIDSIEKSIHQHYQVLRRNRGLSNKIYKNEKVNLKYPFGTALFELLLEREVILLIQKNLDDIKSCEDGIPNPTLDEVSPSSTSDEGSSSSTSDKGRTSSGFIKSVKKKGKSFYREKLNFVQCNFSTAVLPVMLNLPMVSPPLDWEAKEKPLNNEKLTCFDLSGGYLSQPISQINQSYRLLSSSDINKFFIYFDSENQSYAKYFDSENQSDAKGQAGRLCESINWLQSQPHKINSEFLTFILYNMVYMVNNGFLLPEFLSNIRMNEASPLLRECYMCHDSIQNYYKFGEVLEILSKNVQKSRYEQTIIDIAKAYDGYQFYFPAFLDFRGRIYRSGVFHFHERDFARSLIHLSSTNEQSSSPTNSEEEEERFLIATAYHHIGSWKSEFEALTFIRNFIKKFISTPTDKNIDERIISNIKDLESYYGEVFLTSKNPFQFLSNIILYEYSRGDPMKLENLYLSVPITQDASASAYQIMSYYLLDRQMAFKTNLIIKPPLYYPIDKKDRQCINIQDIYDYIRADLVEFLRESFKYDDSTSLSKVINMDVLTRKIVKGIFMPLIYGKTIRSTAADLYNSLSHIIVKKESMILASKIYEFWGEKFAGMQILMKLIPLLGRFVSAHDQPVRYGTEFFFTSQDYRVPSRSTVYVYDRVARKRRSVTLTTPSEKRDKRKTETSTFVNFIHQKDAYIAMKMVEKMKVLKIPIYTVHDNFITNCKNHASMNHFYLKIMKNLGPPLLSINIFIYLNIIKPCPHKNGIVQISEILSEKLLRAFLNAWGIPPSENKKRWETKIDLIVHYYNAYCANVCRETDYIRNQLKIDKRSWAAHEKNWKEFSNVLNGFYSLHH